MTFNQDVFTSSKTRTRVRTEDSEATLKWTFGEGEVFVRVTAIDSVQNKYLFQQTNDNYFTFC